MFVPPTFAVKSDDQQGSFSTAQHLDLAPDIGPDADPPEWIDGLRYLMTFDETSTAGVRCPEGIAEFDENSDEKTTKQRRPSALRDLVWRANHDMLTLVANRAWFLRSAEGSRQALVNQGHSHVLLLLDLDGFKQINDTWGHGAGDAVLVAVAQRLRGLCRSGDLVGRLGGDEFAVWAERVRVEDVPGVARRFLSTFDDTVRFGDVEIDVAGCMGVVISGGETSANDLLNLADAALYDAKKKGRGSFCVFDDALEARMQETHQRELAVVEAVARDEFEFDLQPIVDLETGTPWGVEALARWNSPMRGRLMPGDFLPSIGSMNLFGAFDSLIIEKAAASFEEWRTSMRPPSSIWVNVSPAQLEASFPEYLSEIISAYGIRPGEMVLELTEDAAANTPGRIAVLEAVRELGIEIAIDDFGTGFSQLCYLQDMPLDYVKLDRSFIAGFHTEPRRVAIAESIILLAQAIGAKVVAEGIERQNELDLLIELGCDLAQGYLLSYPGSPADVLGV